MIYEPKNYKEFKQTLDAQKVGQTYTYADSCWIYWRKLTRDDEAIAQKYAGPRQIGSGNFKVRRDKE